MQAAARPLRVAAVAGNGARWQRPSPRGLGAGLLHAGRATRRAGRLHTKEVRSVCNAKWETPCVGRRAERRRAGGR